MNGADVRLGLRPNRSQFALLALVTVFVGLTVGLERTVVPLMAGEEFGIDSALVTLSFITAFGVTKAIANFLAGWLADRDGRKSLLIAGWLAALPVPLMVGLAPSWGWVVAGNLLLGVNQGLCWTMTLVMMSDLAGGRRRGLAIGLNELTGYVAIGLATLASVPLAESHGTRTFLVVAGLVTAVLGLLASTRVQDTLAHAHTLERSRRERLAGPWRSVPRRVLLPRRRPELFACYQAGLVTKINDAGLWGLVPLVLAARELPLGRIGVVSAVYPLVWGLGQGLTGAASDVVDRRPVIVAGMFVQAAGFALLVVADGFVIAVVASATLGLGTALVYPTLLAAVRDIAHGGWEASAFGAYRLWRDTGFVVGALGVGFLADTTGMQAALAVAAVVSAGSGVLALRSLPRGLAGQTRGGALDRASRPRIDRRI